MLADPTSVGRSYHELHATRMVNSELALLRSSDDFALVREVLDRHVLDRMIVVMVDNCRIG